MIADTARKLEICEGREIELERDYGVCPKCGQGIFPLDEELELLPGKLTPSGDERLVRLFGRVPFEKAAELYEVLRGSRGARSSVKDTRKKPGRSMSNSSMRKYNNSKRRGGVQKPARINADQRGWTMVPLLHGVWGRFGPW